MESASVAVLALVPSEAQPYMWELEAAAYPRTLQRFDGIEEMIRDSAESSYAVALIPAMGYGGKAWWKLWGFLNEMEPRPCILVYALQGDFEVWSSVLGAGCFDLIVAPFSLERLSKAIGLASEEFVRVKNESRR